MSGFDFYFLKTLRNTKNKKFRWFSIALWCADRKDTNGHAITEPLRWPNHSKMFKKNSL